MKQTGGLKKGPKIVLLGIVLVALFFGIKWLATSSGLLSKPVQQSVVLQKIDLPTAPKNAASAVKFMPFPTDQVAIINKPVIDFSIWEWNSQMGLILANGGPLTTQGSLMASNGVNLRLRRQDDVPQMQSDLIKFATDLKAGVPNPGGTHLVAIMGDGYASFLVGINEKLAELGDDYRAEAFFSCGKSLGEDKFMGDPSWKENPQNAKGKTIACYMRDGDMNIVLKWCSDNGIAINPDETTYDPDAINFLAADSYIDASQKYLNGYTEERVVVVNGKKTNRKETVKVDGVATWTPGDVMIAEGKGGLISIVSTKEYRSQMPNIVIGIHKWLEDNREQVEGLILAATDAADQIKCYSKALDKAGEISAKVYKDQDGPYWVKYYKGCQKADKKGLIVELGGSAVHNLGDNLEVFGLNPGSTNIAAVVYETFGDKLKELYPKLMPSYPPVETAFNTTFIKNVAEHTTRSGGTISAAEEVTFNNDDANVREVVSTRAWSIEFETGSATISQKSLQEMNKLFNDLVIASTLKVEVHGHTDNTGNSDNNMDLSEKRALAIKQWLESKSPSNFPLGRVNIFAHGQTAPVASNSTEAGRAKNRRVDIILGK